MDYHHVCLVVRDADRTLRLFRDVMGFRVLIDREIPDGGDYFDQRTLDDIFKTAGASSRLVLLASPTGAYLELEEPRVPSVQTTPSEGRRYGWTGIQELAFQVDDLDHWWNAIRDAGYETQTDYIWEVARGSRSFLFYDPDGNMIQLVEEPAGRGRPVAR